MVFFTPAVGQTDVVSSALPTIVDFSEVVESAGSGAALRPRAPVIWIVSPAITSVERAE